MATELDLPAAAREQLTVALAVIDALDAQSEPLTRELRAYGRRQPGCRALMRHYGIGVLTAVTIVAELGAARRFSSSRHAVRYAGLDITVHQSDQRRAPGQLSRQGAHLALRSLGGCDGPDCVVPMCWIHYRPYDTGGVDRATAISPLAPASARPPRPS